MGLTIFAYAVGVIILVLGGYIRDMVGGAWLGRNILITFVGFGVMALANAAAVDLSGLDNATVAPLFAKTGMAGLALGGIFGLRVALSYPYDARHAVLEVFSWIAFGAAAYFVLFTDTVISGFSRATGSLVLAPGDWYSYAVWGLWGLPGLGSLVMVVRSLIMKSRIYRLQSSIIALSGAAVTVIGLAFQLLVLPRAPLFFPLVAFSGLIFLLGTFWAVSITKLFDPRDIAGSVLATAFFVVIAGAPVGAGSAYLLITWGNIPAIPLAAIPALFILATFLYSIFSDKLFKAFNLRGDYLGALERGLAAIDFSQGRGIVFDKLSEVLRGSMNFNDFSVMIEDSEGNLQVAHSNCGAKLTVEHRASPFEFVINMKTDIVLKTEAIANHNFFKVKSQLMDIFTSLKADALVVLHEGHHVIGLIALGQKKSGADYTNYDSNVLRIIYGKLFTIGFYLKNIAKESILTTVDRELQYSNQIIASVQENIDRVDHPKTDLAFLSKSTRKLGGDFIDFVKLAPDRWFFVVGDVSGKGLNASMSMIILKSTIRVFLKEERDFSRLVVKANAFIKENLPRGTFFAGVFGLFDFAKDTMYFVNCGIPVMFMYSPQYNNVLEVQGEGRVLGFVRDYAPYLKLRKISLQKGSILFITTDGIIESESLRNERYGKERVQRSVTEFKAYPAETMAQMTYSSLQKFVGGEINDDVTVMALKYQHLA